MPAMEYMRRATQYAWPFGTRASAIGDVARELLALPPSLWPRDGMFIAEWMDGHFTLAGTAVEIADGSPFDAGHAPDAWRAALYGFEWLRHVPMTADPVLAGRLQAEVQAWLTSAGRRGDLATGVAVTARRVMSWLAHADVVMQTTSSGAYDGIMAALVADVRRLERVWREVDAPAGRLLALIALAQAGLCLDGAPQLQSDAESGLAQLFSGHQPDVLVPLLREPETLAGLILDLEGLRLLYKMRLLRVPLFLPHAVAQLTQSLTARMLGDGRPARLGAVRADAQAHVTLAAVARHVGLPMAGAHVDTAVGFARMAAGATCAIVDVTAPLDSASALEIEMSSGEAPMLVHDGLAKRPGTPNARTLSLVADRAAGTTGSGARSNVPELEAAPGLTTDGMARDSTGPQSIDATHAGLARHGFAHRRRVTLDNDGCLLSGIDELRPMVGRAPANSDAFVVRIVLHPSVAVTLTGQADQVDLMLTNAHQWSFAAPGHQVSVEGALFRDGLRTVPTLQVLVLVDGGAGRSVTWQLTRRDGMATPARTSS